MSAAAASSAPTSTSFAKDHLVDYVPLRGAAGTGATRVFNNMDMQVNDTRTVDASMLLTPQTTGCMPGMRGTAASCFRVAMPPAADARTG